jgi:hypothetical protein
VPREPGFEEELCAETKGFSRHVVVRCEASYQQGLERPCRYITRPALANERVQDNAAGQVVLKLKTHWDDGTTHLVPSPLEFIQRLAAPQVFRCPAAAAVGQAHCASGSCASMN